MITWLKNLVPQGFKNVYHFFVAVLANFYYRFPSKKITVIGVTGTDGKTSTTTLIYHILKSAGKKVAYISTLAAKIGNKDIDTGFHVTSPDPWPLQKLITQIVAKKYDYLILEATSHGLDQHRLLGVKFNIGVLTNITHEHLDYHKTYDNYLRAKAKLFKNANYAILNRDDKSFSKVKSLVNPQAKIISYSLENANPNTLKYVKKRFPESYNQSNALAAIQAAKIIGLNTKDISSAIASFPTIKGRMDEVKNNKGITTIVDFAHTPNSLKAALTSLQKNKKPKAKLIAVFGCASERDIKKRPLMGEISCQLADISVLTAEDPRKEDVNKIIDEIAHGCLKAGAKEIKNTSTTSTTSNTFIRVPDRQKAIDLAIIKLAKKGDIIVALGKGHEQSMCFGTIEYPWSDHEAIKKALRKRK